VITIIFGMVITYAVRNVPSDYNESRWIAFSIYNWVVIGVVLVSYHPNLFSHMLNIGI
jgi:uncharacterized membrane protein